MVSNYTPNKGDIVWISLGPTLGHEQRGRRPALVLSPRSYNGLVGLSIICPLTNISKGYPYEVSVGGKGVILTDQVRSVAWKERKIEYVASLPANVLNDVFDKLKTLLEI